MVHTTKDTQGIPAPTISVFPYGKNNSAYRLPPAVMQAMYESDLPCDDYLTKHTYNQSEAIIDIFLGFTRKLSLLGDNENIVTEKMATPSIGRYYVFRPFFKIGSDNSDQIFVALSRHLNYIIHVYDPHFYLGYFNPSIPMIRETIVPDDTAGKYYNLVLTEVRELLQQEHLLDFRHFFVDPR